MSEDFMDVKVGDCVTRSLAGVKMLLKVSHLDETFIYCGPPGQGWKFRRTNGAEVDEDLGWDTAGTGSRLIRDEGAKPS